MREQRRQAYTHTSHVYVDVLHSLRECADALRGAHGELAGERLALARRAVTDLQVAVFDLRLWGPQEIVSVTKNLRRSAHRALDALTRWHDAVVQGQEYERLEREYHETVDALGEPYADYMRIAASTLGVPETRPPAIGGP
ncbi:hypothetical protein ACIRBZ_35955 [Streptomyces sp. NPDC094038]|uniref:hypothetical protein n=1 Tax=Streptomyces sp. NPDC094038 TaxID=3366055 RepID=UPI00380D9D0E